MARRRKYGFDFELPLERAYDGFELAERGAEGAFSLDGLGLVSRGRPGRGLGLGRAGRRGAPRSIKGAISAAGGTAAGLAAGAQIGGGFLTSSSAPVGVARAAQVGVPFGGFPSSGVRIGGTAPIFTGQQQQQNIPTPVSATPSAGPGVRRAVKNS